MDTESSDSSCVDLERPKEINLHALLKNAHPVGNETQHVVEENALLIDGVVFKEKIEKILDFHDPTNPEGMLIRRNQMGDQIYEVTEFLKDKQITRTHVTTGMADDQVALFISK